MDRHRQAITQLHSLSQRMDGIIYVAVVWTHSYDGSDDEKTVKLLYVTQIDGSWQLQKLINTITGFAVLVTFLRATWNNGQTRTSAD